MFATRYFACRYFAARYFPMEIVVVAPPGGGYRIDVFQAIIGEVEAFQTLVGKIEAFQAFANGSILQTF